MNALPFPLSTLRAHWKLIGAAFLLLALIIQTFRLSATEGALSAEKAGRRADRASYEKAQAQATAEALSAKLKKDAENAQAAQTADAGYNALRERYDRLLRVKAADRSSGRTIAPAEGYAPSVHESAPAMLDGFRPLPESDWLKLPALQSYADQCFNWSMSLANEEGHGDQ